MKLNDIFTFGKHRGESLGYVVQTDAQYVRWCMNNIPNFTIPCETQLSMTYKTPKRSRYFNSPFGGRAAYLGAEEDWMESQTCPW